MVAHTSAIPASQEVELRGQWFKANRSKKLARPHINQQTGHGGHVCGPSYVGGVGRGISL
jgi:hypothetical protein